MKFNSDQAKRFLEDVLADVAAASATDLQTPADQPPDLPPMSQASGESPPQRIGRFVIVRKLAEGGMGTVYLARQTNPNREVAIKVFARGDVDRFRQEAETLARLKHSGIAHIHESGSHDDGLGARPYFVMEYLPNAEPITSFAHRIGLDLDQKLELFLQVCEAVQHAHLKGVIHRDLKPGNILVTYEDEAVSGQPLAVSDPLAPGSAGGHDTPTPTPSSSATPWPVRVCLIDFGVARITNADLRITLLPTTTSEILGTMQYMSPEQCLGRIGDIDTRSDVYTLGVILYELVCGRLPYDIGEDASITNAARTIEEHEPIRPTAIIRKLPRDLEAVVLKALEKNAERRYQSVAELVEDLRRQLRGEHVEARRPTRWMRVAKWVSRHPITTTAGACVGIALLMIASSLVSIMWLNSRPYRFGPIASDSKSCNLLSRTDRILDSIGGGADSGVYCAILADRPSRFGGDQVALFAVHGGQGRHPTFGQLRMTKADDLDRLIWETEATPPFIEAPEHLSEDANSYNVTIAMVADVFPDHGDEIIVIHPHYKSSPCAIRVYAFDRTVLFEAWHRGHVRSLYWDPGRQVLVCAGDGRRSSKADPAPPQVVFGLRMQRGMRLGCLNQESDLATRNALAWYRAIYPIDAFDDFTVRLTIPSRSDFSNRGVAVCYNSTTDFAIGCNLILDLARSGDVVPGAGSASQNYTSGRLVPIDKITAEDVLHRLDSFPEEYGIRVEPIDWSLGARRFPSLHRIDRESGFVGVGEGRTTAHLIQADASPAANTNTQ